MSFLSDIALVRKPVTSFAAMGLFWGAFGGLAPVLKRQVGASDGEFGLAMLAASCGALLAMLTAPRADRFLGRNVLPVLTALMALAWFMPGRVDNVILFAFAMGGAAITSGTLDVVMNARLSQLEADRGTSMMNFAHGSYSLVYAFSALGAGLALEAGYTPLAYLSALSVLVLIAATTTRQRARPPISDTSGTGTRARGALIWLGGFVILIGFMAEQATEGWSALHLERATGAGAAASAVGPAVLGLTMAVGRYSGQWLVNRFSEIAVLRVAGVLGAAGSALAAVSSDIVLVYAGFAILGLGISVIAPMTYALVGRRVSDATRTDAIARISVIGYSGFFFGPPIMGFLAQWQGLPASFGFIALVLLLMAGPMLYALRRA